MVLLLVRKILGPFCQCVGTSGLHPELLGGPSGARDWTKVSVVPSLFLLSNQWFCGSVQIQFSYFRWLFRSYSQLTAHVKKKPSSSSDMHCNPSLAQSPLWFICQWPGLLLPRQMPLEEKCSPCPTSLHLCSKPQLLQNTADRHSLALRKTNSTSGCFFGFL